jgi:hypothetical protein
MGGGHYAVNPSLIRTHQNPDFKPISACPLMYETSKNTSKPWAELGGLSKNEVFPKYIVLKFFFLNLKKKI